MSTPKWVTEQLQKWWKDALTPTPRAQVVKVTRMNGLIMEIGGLISILTGIVVGCCGAEGNWPLLILGGTFIGVVGYCARNIVE